MRHVDMKKAFTLIELLVVVAIISMLLGLISVGLHKTSVTAKNLRQKSVFHGMEIGLELFSKDFDGYPDSKQIDKNPSEVITGSQHLAEALVGRDGQGFDPETDWYAPDDGTADGDPYVGQKSLDRRKPLYLEFQHFEARTLDEIFEASVISANHVFTKDSTGTQRAPILTDVFQKNPVIDGKGKTGTPILYFKANRSKKAWEFRDKDPDANDWLPETYRKWVYNLEDNLPLLNMEIANPDLLDTKYTQHFPDTDHPIDAPEYKRAGAFYRFLTNAEADTTGAAGIGGIGKYRPFNPNTFLLISAGNDGVYGTKDDITNFNY